MWPSPGWSQTCPDASLPYFSWHNAGGVHFSDLTGLDYVRPTTGNSQGNCNTCSYYATTQAAKIAYRIHHAVPTFFTGHAEDPDPDAVRVNFSEEGLRSKYSMVMGVEPSCADGPSDPTGLLEKMAHPETGFKMVPQWRSPNRTRNVLDTGMRVQLQPDMDQPYMVIWQEVPVQVEVPFVRVEDFVRSTKTLTYPPLDSSLLKSTLACGRPYLGIPAGPLVASVCMNINGTYSEPTSIGTCGSASSHSKVERPLHQCWHRNLFHPGCMHAIHQLKNNAGYTGMTLSEYLQGFDPCDLVHQGHLISFSEISGRIESGELATYGWPNLDAFLTWLSGRADACGAFMNPGTWKAERSISLSNTDFLGTASCGTVCQALWVCPDYSFKVGYTKDTEAPSGDPASGLFWVQVPDDKIMIGGCPCQDEYYPGRCDDRCQEETGGLEPISANSNLDDSNSWDPLYGNCPHGLSTSSVVNGPPISSFCTARINQQATSSMIQHKGQFYDYDLWVEETGGNPDLLQNYQELDPTQGGRFWARYSKHPDFVDGVPAAVWGTEVLDAAFSTPLDFLPGTTCAPVGIFIHNWVAASVRIIPDVVERGPVWGISKVGDPGQLITGTDPTGMVLQQVALLDDQVMNLRVIPGGTADSPMFLAAHALRGNLNHFRRYHYQEHVMVDKGEVTVSGVPTLFSVSLIPLDDSSTILIGRSSTTTWEIYQLKITENTGTLQHVAQLGRTDELVGFWEYTSQNKSQVTLFARTRGMLVRYQTEGKGLDKVYEINKNLPIHSAARTDYGVALVAGNGVFLLDDSAPVMNELLQNGLPPSVAGFTVVPRTRLKIWGLGTNGERDGYLYYPQMETWEKFGWITQLP